MKGILVAVLGADGSGKTWLSSRIYEAYRKYIPCELFAPYSSLPLSKRLTEVSNLKGVNYSKWRVDRTYQLDVSTNIRKKVAPLLEQGIMVISDRYYHCAEVYAPELESIRHLAPKPDLIIFCDRSPEESYDRIVQRSKRTGAKIEDYETVEGIRQTRDRYERLLNGESTNVVRIRTDVSRSERDILLPVIDAINETFLKVNKSKQETTRQEEEGHTIGE